MNDLSCSASGCEREGDAVVTEIAHRKVAQERSFCREHGENYLARRLPEGHIFGLRSLRTVPGATCCDLAFLVTRKSSRQQFLHIREVGGERWLSLFIDFIDAAILLGGIKSPNPTRPTMFDTMGKVIEELDGQIEYIHLQDVKGSRAAIAVTKSSKSITVDSRVCDAISLAVRSQAPIFVSNDLLNSGWRKQ